MTRKTSEFASGGSNLESDLESLQSLGLARLREFWSNRWGRAPRLRSPEALRLITAWKLQAEEFGGFDELTHRQLRHKAGVRRPLPPGARITREYLGVLHTVEVGAGTLSYAGRSYSSLTKIAREITGTHWSGPRFFGLNRQAPK